MAGFTCSGRITAEAQPRCGWNRTDPWVVLRFGFSPIRNAANFACMSCPATNLQPASQPGKIRCIILQESWQHLININLHFAGPWIGWCTSKIHGDLDRTELGAQHYQRVSTFFKRTSASSYLLINGHTFVTLNRRPLTSKLVKAEFILKITLTYRLVQIHLRRSPTSAAM